MLQDTKLKEKSNLATKPSQGYVLRLYGNIEVFVEDIYKCMKALEYAYNCAYVLDSITQQAEELAEQYGTEPPPIPLRNLLWCNWWPPDAEKIAGLVPDRDRLKLRGVEVNFPGFWDFIGKLNPLEVMRQYLNERHKRKKEREDRNQEEARKLDAENELLELEVIKKKVELLKELGGFTPQDIDLLKDRLLKRPLQGLNPSQDQQLIIDAQIVNPELGNKKRVASWSNQDIVTVNSRGEIIQAVPCQAQYLIEDLGNGVILEMVAISGGTFQMGSPESENYDDKESLHQVKVQPFFMGKYPITQAQWRAVASLPKVNKDLNPEPSLFKGDNRPVEQVSWYDAVEFCERLSKQTGKEYRLPSEAEWEYACRAETTTPFHFGETITTELANYHGSYTFASGPKGEYREQTTSVGSFPPNAFGLYDMHGNVWERCQDNWHDSCNGAPEDGTAWLSGTSHLTVVRGGSWDDDPYFCRSACRDSSTRGDRGSHFGFRVVCVAFKTT